MIKHNINNFPDIDFQKWKSFGDNYVGDYIIDNTNKFAIENSIKWLYGEPFDCNIAGKTETKKGNPNKGLYIAGPCGTGKTLFAKILRDYAKSSGVTLIIEGKTVKTNWIPVHATEITDQFQNGEDIGIYKRQPILHIEDLGTEPISSNYMGNKTEVLKNIIERRGDFDCVTIITSNYRPDSNTLLTKYGERVQSRLKGLNYFSINGSDRR